MKVIIDIDDRLYNDIRNCADVQIASHEAIKNGIPYEDKIKQIADLLETECGYEGIREDVERIMREEER